MTKTITFQSKAAKSNRECKLAIQAIFGVERVIDDPRIPIKQGGLAVFVDKFHGRTHFIGCHISLFLLSVHCFIVGFLFVYAFFFFRILLQPGLFTVIFKSFVFNGLLFPIVFVLIFVFMLVCVFSALVCRVEIFLIIFAIV